ncbi:hypothetical protein [Vreelandella venusta]|uniref:Uncharacterized protein n=1 Tax=Vreelandella venusta TaxID=44935 RepID=A0AAQ0CI97_9GAMM|nr:hypothetical protein [Halomonas venusta]QRL05168.1 hypothetical protein JDS37_09645 [Halomonas venusta]GEK50939.1 hypothetical protein HVE01_16600 [Halomonas venusta]
MSQPTHTHRTSGGKYAELQQHEGAGPLAGQRLVIYEDLDKGIQSATTQDDWLANWREIAPDDCPLCLGSGIDPIKGVKYKPCGHCYGLGKVKGNGEQATEQWDVADIALTIIAPLREKLESLQRIADNPAVQALIEQQRQQVVIDSMARQEQEWRDSRGHGPGGQRMTGD